MLKAWLTGIARLGLQGVQALGGLGGALGALGDHLGAHDLDLLGCARGASQPSSPSCKLTVAAKGKISGIISFPLFAITKELKRGPAVSVSVVVVVVASGSVFRNWKRKRKPNRQEGCSCVALTFSQT